jgi:hypothetical protein
MESNVVERLFGSGQSESSGMGEKKARTGQAQRSLTGEELWAALLYLEGYLQETAERIRRTKRGAQDGADSLLRQYGGMEPKGLERDALEQRYGREGAGALFREAGARAGKEFYAGRLSVARGLEEFLAAIRESFQKLGLGIFRVELTVGFIRKNAGGRWEAIVLVDENTDGLELPVDQELVSVYEARFIQGILDCLSRGDFYTKDIGWCAGMWTCRLEAKLP